MSRAVDLPIVDPEESNISANELIEAIKHTKNLKVADIYELVLKNMSFGIFEHVAVVLNKCSELRYLPTRWKLAKVIPINKPTSAESYRPISLLSSILKLFGTMSLSHLLEFTNQNNIWHDGLVFKLQRFDFQNFLVMNKLSVG